MSTCMDCSGSGAIEDADRNKTIDCPACLGCGYTGPGQCCNCKAISFDTDYLNGNDAADGLLCPDCAHLAAAILELKSYGFTEAQWSRTTGFGLRRGVDCGPVDTVAAKYAAKALTLLGIENLNLRGVGN